MLQVIGIRHADWNVHDELLTIDCKSYVSQ